MPSFLGGFHFSAETKTNKKYLANRRQAPAAVRLGNCKNSKDETVSENTSKSRRTERWCRTARS